MSIYRKTIDAARADFAQDIRDNLQTPRFKVDAEYIEGQVFVTGYDCDGNPVAGASFPLKASEWKTKLKKQTVILFTSTAMRARR